MGAEASSKARGQDLIHTIIQIKLQVVQQAALISKGELSEKSLFELSLQQGNPKEGQNPFKFPREVSGCKYCYIVSCPVESVLSVEREL